MSVVVVVVVVVAAVVVANRRGGARCCRGVGCHLVFVRLRCLKRTDIIGNFGDLCSQLLVGVGGTWGRRKKPTLTLTTAETHTAPVSPDATTGAALGLEASFAADGAALATAGAAAAAAGAAFSAGTGAGCPDDSPPQLNAVCPHGTFTADSAPHDSLGVVGSCEKSFHGPRQIMALRTLYDHNAET